MEMISAEYLSALGSIVILDLILGGDNAIIIGIAAHRLDEKTKKKVIFYGILAALLIRTIMTFMAVGLLKIPFLQCLGGLLLIPVAIKLNEMGHEKTTIASGNTFFEAIKIILIADALMGIDNVLAVAGASGGDFSLILLGLIISIPILIWGSQFLSKMLNRFKILIKLGAAVVAWTAGRMVINDPIVGMYFKNEIWGSSFLLPLLSVIFVMGVILYKELKNKYE